MSGEKSKGLRLNRLALFIFAFVLVLNAAIFVLWNKFQDNYVNYQRHQVTIVKEEISKYLSDEETLVENFEKLEKEYNLEVLVLSSDGVTYTSNGIETIRQQEEIYDDHFLYKELFEEQGYRIWLSINGVDFVEYINFYLLANVILASLIVITFMLFIYFFLRQVVNSLVGVYKLIIDLRGPTHEDVEEDKLVLDNINDELLLLISQLSLSYYNVKTIDSEKAEIINYQKSLLEEQKQYLETAIHDIKTPISTIGFALYSLNRNYDLEKDVANEVDYLYNQTQKTLAMVVNSLETVRDDSLDIFIEEANVVINEIVEKNFKDSELILSKRNITYTISGSECVIYTNRIKVIQMLNNITSNMIIYGADNSNMEIIFEDTKVVFKNVFDNRDNKYTTKRGKKFIANIADELDFEVVESVEDNTFITSIDFGEHNTLC